MNQRTSLRWLCALLVGLLLVGCGDDNRGEANNAAANNAAANNTAASNTAASDTATSDTAASDTVASDTAASDTAATDAVEDTGEVGSTTFVDHSMIGAGTDLDMQAGDFKCIRDGVQVGRYFVANPLGYLDEAVEVARSQVGGRYPVGTILQLVPQEAMVKRKTGWSTETNDWEFFALAVDGSETTIQARGAADTINAFGGNCFECHAQAAPEWDMVCESTHGCAPLPITPVLIEMLQNGDSRCP